MECVPPPRESGCDSAEDLTGHRRVRVHDVVPAGDPCTLEDARAPERDEPCGVHAGAQRVELVRCRAALRNDDPNRVPAPDELGGDAERHPLPSPDPGVEQVEEDPHVGAGGRLAWRTRAGNSEATSGRRMSWSRNARRGAARIAVSANRLAAARWTSTWCEDASCRRKP